MGKKAVRVTGALWQDICTVGWRGTFECTEGLPEGAVFCFASFLLVAYEPGPAVVVVVTFEHPDWPEIEPGEDVPTLDIVWTQTYDDAGT